MNSPPSVQSAQATRLPYDIDWSSAAEPAAELGGAGLVASQYYELRLEADAQQVDYLISFKRNASQALARAVAALDKGEGHRASGWRDIDALLSTWSNPASSMGMRCPTVWFEYDDIGERKPLSVPSVSVCLTPHYRAGEPHRAQAADDLALAHEVLELLGARPGERDALSAVFSALPSGARFIHLSTMLGRQPRAVKLYGVLKYAELRAYLARIQWKGDWSAIEDALARLYPRHLLGEELFIDLNLENFRDDQRATLGLAVAQQHLYRGPEPDPERSAVLDAWTQAGLCDPAKVRAVMDWPSSARGVKVGRFEREHRFLDVKLVWQAKGGLVAKAYLGRHRLRGLF